MKEFTNRVAFSHAIRAVPYLLILLPVGISLFYVHLFGVNVFFADEWDMVRPLQKLHSGTLGIADLFAQHNEHRYLFPWISLLLLGTVTDYNTIPAMYLVQVCFLVVLVALFLVFRRSIDRASLSILFFVPVPFLLFSLRQAENFLWGNQVTFAFVVAFGVLAFYFLYVLGSRSPKKLAFSAALASATIATFSAVQGLLVWPAGLLQLLISPIERPAKKIAVGVWSLAGLVEWVIFFAGYVKPGGTPSVFFVLNNPATGMSYLLTLLGGSLFWDQDMAVVGGSLLACLTVASLFLTYKGGELKENSFWMALLLFSFLSLAAITAGRSGFGEEQAFAQALASRFTAFSILGVISIYAVLAKLASERKTQVTTALFGVLLGLVLLSVPVSYVRGIEAGATIQAYREQVATTIFNYESQPDQALAISGNRPERVREHASFLDRLDYNVFSE